MNDRQSNSTQLVRTTGGTGQFGPCPVCGLPRRHAILRRPLTGCRARHWRGKAATGAGQLLDLESDVTGAVEQLAGAHTHSFDRPVSVP